MVSHRGERSVDEEGSSSNPRSQIHRVRAGKVERLRPWQHESIPPTNDKPELPLQSDSSEQSGSEESGSELTEDAAVPSDEVAAAERWRRHKETLAALDVSVKGVISSMMREGSVSTSQLLRTDQPSPTLRESVTDQAVAMAIRRHGLYTCGSSQSVVVGGISQPPAHLLERAVLSEAVSLAIQRKGLQGAILPH